MGTSKGSAKRKAYSYDCQHLKTERAQINNLMKWEKLKPFPLRSGMR
jgi:hypothetical protein